MDDLGIFDEVATALEFDDKRVTAMVSNIRELKDRLPEAMQKCLAFFAGADRTVEGYEGLIAAQQCLPNKLPAPGHEWLDSRAGRRPWNELCKRLHAATDSGQ